MLSLGIIPDGNRRYAKKHNITLEEAYEIACRKVEDVITWCFNSRNIDELTLWGLSTENMKRDAIELRLLNNLFKRQFQRLLASEQIHEKKVNVKVVGNRRFLEPEVAELALKVEESTRDYKAFRLNIALAYGGHDEIIHAFQKALKNKTAALITEEDIQKNLYIQRNPDFIIRTSGMNRLSGFMTWQSAYSELYFSKQLWPELDEQEFKTALEYYYSTQKNFGK